MYSAVSSIWVFVCTYLCHVFGSFFRYIFRFKHGEDDHGIGSDCCQASEIDKGNREKENSVVTETVLLANSSKYEFIMCGEGVSQFIEETKASTFAIHEVFLDSEDGKVINSSCIDSGNISDKDFEEPEIEAEDFVGGKPEETGESVRRSVIKEVLDTQEHEDLEEEKISDDKETVIDDRDGDVESTIEDFEKAEETGYSVESLVTGKGFKKQLPEKHKEENISKEKDLLGLDDRIVGDHYSFNEVQLVLKSDEAGREHLCLAEEFSRIKDEIDSITYELSDGSTVIEELENGSPAWTDDEEKIDYKSEPEAVFMRHQSPDSDDEYIEFEPPNHNSVLLDEEVFSREDINKDATEEKTEQKLDSVVNFDVEDDTDYMFDHEDIIAQLKMVMKHARTGGLPTILEEPETEEESEQLQTPKMTQELKPLKIENKFEHRDCMEEIQKVYKSYSDKMHKLDILNFQTMHALGLHQLKDTFQWQITRKYSLPAMKNLLMHNLWSCKQGSAVVSPTDKVIADVHRDFELVYIGQLCLSWEMLHWQYQKVEELQNFHGSHQYNQAASEFQLFQVLLQRFLENETFQGPRVQNYVKNRCTLRNLLQIPAIKDDNLREKAEKEDNEDAVTSQMLRETVEESMRVFWEFLRVDKDHQTYVNLHELVNIELLINTQSKLQKKEKKLKDIIRSGNCIVRRFQRQREDGKIHCLLLIAQVELKLVSRVLNMSRLTTDQLMWCHEKLEKIKINFSSGKVLVEPSFLLFPC